MNPQEQKPNNPPADKERAEPGNQSGCAAMPSDEDIQAFIINIKSGSIDKMKEMLECFRENISNKLESQMRQPPLYFAVTNSDSELGLEMIKMLIQAGANPNFKDANEQTIMFYACKDGKGSIVKYMSELGCKLDEEDLYGQTPLFYVANENQIELLDFFTPEMLNHVDKLAKQTPLYYAARRGHLQMCKKLVEKGCDVNHHDSANKTAAEYAKKSKFQDVADYLTAQIKKVKESNRIENSSINQKHVQESSQNENTVNNPKSKKKKENTQFNPNKYTYKLTVYKENGELHDLTEEEVKQLFKTASPELETYLNNPESIPPELLEAHSQQSWEKVASKVLSQCYKLKSALEFREPVEPLKYGITDYFDLIKRPMDLGTIKKKLTYNAYSKAKDFADDVSLVWKNCYQYNGTQHEISQCAKEIEKTFEAAVVATGFNKYLQE